MITLVFDRLKNFQGEKRKKNYINGMFSFSKSFFFKFNLSRDVKVWIVWQRFLSPLPNEKSLDVSKLKALILQTTK